MVQVGDNSARIFLIERYKVMIEYILHRNNICSALFAALVKIVYTNYNVALVYECQSLGADNRCETDQEFLDVLSKDAHGFTPENLDELEEHLNSACVQKDEMQLASHHCACIGLSRDLSCEFT